MKLKKIIAGVIVSAISMTTLIAPMEKAVPDSLKSGVLLTAQAADKTIETDYVFEASASTKDDAPNKVRVAVPVDATTLTFNFETEATSTLSMGIYGAEINEDPYWEDLEVSFELEPVDGKASYTYKVPASVKGKLKKICIGFWYPKSGITINLTSITHDGTKIVVEPSGPQEVPESENAKSGTCSFTDNKDGTATVSSTLTKTIAVIDDEEMDIPLTAGDPKSNSYKFALKDFGIVEEGADIQVQSFNYKFQSEDVVDTFTYGGGITVTEGSPSDAGDTWYNDPDGSDKYVVKNAGTYANVVWDVPSTVQPDVALTDAATVSIQLWDGSLLNPDEEDQKPVLHLISASCTYTKTAVIPYDKTVTKKVNETLGGKTTKLKYELSESGIEKRCYAGAIKFTFSTSAATDEIQIGLGVSVADTKPEYEGWYMPESGVTIINPDTKKCELMWILPEDVMKDVYYEKGKLEFAVWYAGEKNTVTLSSIEFYERLTREEDLEVKPEESFELLVAEQVQLETNIEGCTFESANEDIAIVSPDGVVTGISVGEAEIIVKTPEGQTAEVYAIVVDEKTPPTESTAPTDDDPDNTTKKTTKKTTKPTTGGGEEDDTTTATTVKEDLTGDINLDGKVNSADLVILNKYLTKKVVIKAADSKAKADVNLDEVVNVFDSVSLRRIILSM